MVSRQIIMRPQRAFLLVAAISWGAMFAAPASGFIISNPPPTPWLSTASGSRSGNGAPATITWSIVPDGTTTLKDEVTRATAPSNLISFMNTTFGGSPSQTDLTQEPWFHLFNDSFSRWSQLGSVNYVYEPHDDGTFHSDTDSNGVLGVRGDIRLAGMNIDGAGSVLAFTWLPPSTSDIVIDTSESSFFNVGTSNFINFRNTLMHELGHSFALQHVNSPDSNLLMEPFIDTTFDGPQLDEVRGVQFFFGDVNEKSNGGLGNGTAARASSLGAIAAGGTKTIGAAANVPGQAISATATDFVSISNVNDTDFYSFAVSAPSLFGATLTPRGGVFTQSSSGMPFDANARNNLALTLFSTDGLSILATANANPAGGIESIANLVLPAAGTYFARITGADDTIQLYELSLTATPILLGDYNKDGVVDAADYVVWRKTQGQSATIGTGADGNFDGQITATDYNVWRSHFGQLAGAGAGSGAELGEVFQSNVPEPTSVVLALSGCLATLLGRRARVRKTI